MIAVPIASSVPASAFGWMVAISVAALGVGPLASWAHRQPAVPRIATATALAFLLFALFVVGAQHQRFADIYISCDSWYDYFPICWALFG